MPPVILAINPGSTSTATALFEGDSLLAESRAESSGEPPAGRVAEQAPARAALVRGFLESNGHPLSACSAIAARGGPLEPVPGGVYRINGRMIEDARSERFVEHISKVACLIADELGGEARIPAFIVDPVSTDEFDPVSRISGHASLPRKSLTHALNMKRCARIAARGMGRAYEDLNLITAHLGGGVSIAVHHEGRMIDSVDANGEGPFSPERAGGLRADDLARMACESGRPFRDIRAELTKRGGLISHLGTADAREIERRITAGDGRARLVFEALAYQVSKHILSLSAAVRGQVDLIIVTGGLANSHLITAWIEDRVRVLAPVRVMAGSHEMEALRDGVLRVLEGTERPRVYPTGEYE
ncbi:butyrate kinase [Candidatus Poribacteria bacterium]|nr:butyrate kinase [Candidatus Poribacteria bacterium]